MPAAELCDRPATIEHHTSSVIAATSGAVAIDELRASAGVSSTHLTQRFKELIGVTPKRLARTYRFATTVPSINPAGPIDWADLASSAGYFDQAHFGHEFRGFTGRPLGARAPRTSQANQALGRRFVQSAHEALRVARCVLEEVVRDPLEIGGASWVHRSSISDGTDARPASALGGR